MLSYFKMAAINRLVVVKDKELIVTWSLVVISPSVIKSHSEYTAKMTKPSRTHRVVITKNPIMFIHKALKDTDFTNLVIFCGFLDLLE